MRLTSAQTRALKAAEFGGVRGFGSSAGTIIILQKRGYLTLKLDHWGYFNITPTGRIALKGTQHDN